MCSLRINVTNAHDFRHKNVYKGFILNLNGGSGYHKFHMFFTNVALLFKIKTKDLDFITKLYNWTFLKHDTKLAWTLVFWFMTKWTKLEKSRGRCFFFFFFYGLEVRRQFSHGYKTFFVWKKLINKISTRNTLRQLKKVKVWIPN